MDPTTEAADRALDAFRASRTVEGRFLSYCRGRSRHFWTRQALILIFAPLFLIFADWELTLAMALTVFLGEALDCLVLARLGASRNLSDKLHLAIGITTLTGAIQAATICVFVAFVATIGGEETRSLAGAIFLAALLDAALLYGVHRGAAVVRIILYLLALFVLSLQGWLHFEGTDRKLVADVVGTILLLYVGWSVIRHDQKYRNRRSAAQLALLEGTRTLAHTNDALEQSRQTTKRLAMVAERANDSVIITDADGNITWVNRAFTRATGYSFSEVVGRSVDLLDGPQTQKDASARLVAARRDQRPIRLEIINHRKDGAPIWVEVSMTPVFGEHGELMNMVSVERDISEAKEREHALAEARRVAEDAVRARHTFLATMSHEIRTPMNGVIGMADLLLDTDLDPMQRSCVRTINSSGEALLAIINDILDFSKLGAGGVEIASEPFSPRACFQGVMDLVQPLAETKDLELHLVLPASLPEWVRGDQGRLRQVLLNLLGNAIKFTERGSVRVEVAIRLDGDDCHLMMSVRDTGIGIAPEQLERVFDFFTQADATVAERFGGTGLGLSISKALVEAMGGEISAASRPGEGAVFHVSVTLPLASVAASGTGDPEGKLAHSRLVERLSGLRMLIAEDNRTNTLLLERMLAATGAQLSFAMNGREAIDLFREHAPVVVLMDVHMPILDGLEATREIRRLEATAGLGATPIIAITANAFPEDRDLCKEAGMTDFVTKPFRKLELFAAIRACLDAESQESVGPPRDEPRRKIG